MYKKYYYLSLSAIRVLAQRLHDVLIDVSVDQDTIRHKFLAMLEVSLWGNKCDLSISAGSAQNFSNDPLEQVSRNVPLSETFKDAFMLCSKLLRVSH